MGNVADGGPHSSMREALSGGWKAYQQVVTSESLNGASIRNLLSTRLRGREPGGIKSQGTMTKSSEMREEKWRSNAQVPSLVSSSKVWRSILREDGETLE
jgi:hypothetical protein